STPVFSMSLACRCAATVKRGSSPIAAHVGRSRLTPLYTAGPKSSARAGKPATVPITVMEAVQIEETATILRFVVIFASGDGSLCFLQQSMLTTGAFAMFGIGPTGLSKAARRAP